MAGLRGKEGQLRPPPPEKWFLAASFLRCDDANTASMLRSALMILHALGISLQSHHDLSLSLSSKILRMLHWSHE
ncbi:hypothetical protein E6O75_ATG06278 [Venturia nashicola]|uniref:Uncharacterized protein n=1 Tax=Venturia nashicola TaxID=86259 RepID=A0A4Z1NUD1_9PEZI|nr:hypothetical protein E6O75_ATG06278 [Venturia nashicola]